MAYNKTKTIIILASALFLAGCLDNTNVRPVKVQEIKVPFLYCPAPPKVHRPILVIDTLSDADRDDPGKVAQAYKASFLQLRGYAENLEQILLQYDDTAAAYEDLRKQMRELYPDQNIQHLEKEAVNSIPSE